MASGRDRRIGHAHDIASKLEADGIGGPEAGTILAMALGILAESEEGSHRNLRILVEVHLEVAQRTFDAMRLARKARRQ